MEEEQPQRPKKLIDSPDPLVVGAAGAGALFVAAVAAVGGWIGYSRLKVNHETTLPDSIEADRRTFISSAAGQLSYYQDRAGEGRPLVLIHSINAAGSSYEMRPIFNRYRGKRPVYALDLPGFGFSDRGRRAYSPTLYTQAIVDFISTQLPKEPVDVVALSLGSEFAARAALQHPDLFHSLTLISPSGFVARDKVSGSQRASRSSSTSDRLYRTFSFPLWSQALYDLLGTPFSIRYFLKQSFQGKPDKGLMDYDYLTAHQPGAKNAPLYFISGKLFSPEIYDDVYTKLTLPVQVLYDRDPFVRFDKLTEITAQHPNWHATRITPTKGLPQFDRMDDTERALDSFWESVK